MIGMMARSGAGVFPPRHHGQTDGDLRKELNERGAPRDSTILTRTELDIIRDMIAGKNIMTTTRTAVRARSEAAEEHKRRMMQYDDQRRMNGDFEDKSLEKVEDEQNRLLNLERAKTLLDEQFDEVKAMNQILGEAKCIAVRNAQIAERKLREEEEKEYERKMEELMAVEAEKALKMYKDREQQQVENRKKTLAIIRAQLDEREKDRIRKLEVLQAEQEAMTRHIARLHEEAAAEKLRQQEKERRVMEAVALANADQISLKKRQQEMEEEEMKRISEYIKKKQERERLYAEEQQRIRDEKEREVARLRAQQLRVQNKQAQLDEIRAQREQEAYAREVRRKERERKEHEMAMLQELATLREQQIEERKRLKSEQRKQEEEEMERIVAVHKVAEEKERQRKMEMRRQYEENSLAVLKQIMDVEERRRRERQEAVAEGNHLMMQLREREAAIAAIRERKLRELEELGVPDEYFQALEKKIKGRPKA
ncbi:Trichohyalin plectin like domain [Trypanosoma vivax]|uniref:Cilia- and flagella-associated protein 45 n=1 Tax=Trypanosoma vivax (strain Y486) TaxID=1055687 RepID=G0U144_TRYVY|nr:hypothetical protein TRVL_08901 [Trypanosoma vivax]KAH8607958.1 Trichohyalin plectin like domain [Trypanosoma vivax]CCC49799.1 conserved hypothetical protein [Trypanosoma vivax Y486]